MISLLLGVARDSRVAGLPPQAAGSRFVAADGERTVAGTWGGEHVRMEASEKGARFVFDCAEGTIDGPITLGSDGSFRAAGTLVRESHGPIRQGHEPRPEAATYSGSIQDDTMTLRVSLAASSQDVADYTLRRGEAGRVRRCQ